MTAAGSSALSCRLSLRRARETIQLDEHNNAMVSAVRMDSYQDEGPEKLGPAFSQAAGPQSLDMSRLAALCHAVAIVARCRSLSCYRMLTGPRAHPISKGQAQASVRSLVRCIFSRAKIDHAARSSQKLAIFTAQESTVRELILRGARMAC